MGDADKVGKEFIQVQLRLAREEAAASEELLVRIRGCNQDDKEVVTRMIKYILIHINNKPIHTVYFRAQGNNT